MNTYAIILLRRPLRAQCERKHYMFEERCYGCPNGADCDDTGVTLESMQVGFNLAFWDFLGMNPNPNPNPDPRRVRATFASRKPPRLYTSASMSQTVSGQQRAEQTRRIGAA